MADNEKLTRELAKVISDPGSVLPRHQFWRGEYESVPRWAARAVLASLPSLPGVAVDKHVVTEWAAVERGEEDFARPDVNRQMAEADVAQNNRAGLPSYLAKREVRYGPWTEVSDTAVEGEVVLEADDTVPVEKLAHWLHGEFDTSAEDSDLLPWAQEREGVKARYRRAARALMSQLPELFR